MQETSATNSEMNINSSGSSKASPTGGGLEGAIIII